MIGRFAVALFAVTGILLSTCVAAPDRGLLWRVVQTCIANHNLTGAAFPCLAVETANGAAAGFATLRSPLDHTHIIVTPTVRTIGIEAERLRAQTAPDYFADAWAARHFVSDALGHELGRADLAMAVNSRIGRSQDQLHLHVDCVRPALRDSLLRQEHALHAPGWTRIVVLPAAPPYWATTLQSTDLAGVNLFDALAKGMRIDADDMDDWTIVVVGASSIRGKPGFFVLARKLIPDGHDIAHGEALLDHDCRGFR